MKSSRISDALFGIPDPEMSRAARIEIIRKAIQDESYLTEERLDEALDKMLEEIRAD